MIREGDRVYALGVGEGVAIEQLGEAGWHISFDAYTAYCRVCLDKEPDRLLNFYVYKIAGASDCPEEEVFEDG